MTNIKNTMQNRRKTVLVFLRFVALNECEFIKGFYN